MPKAARRRPTTSSPSCRLRNRWPCARPGDCIACRPQDLAVVAADTEPEARTLAATHDALRGDWCSPQFATADFEDTAETHVFGDVVISARAASPIERSKKR